MSVIFLWFPAGLVLYMFVSNLITLVQAKIIYAAMDKKGLKRVKQQNLRGIAMPSFDIVSEIELPELQNAIENANRELETRLIFAA